ncbi:MAG: DnaJ domain-containing protein, partial [Methylococcaceae bacterium]
MKTPFEILEIDVEADDETIKKAYLRKVRQHPPERDSAAFQTIRDAYEAVKTRQDKIRHTLFN